MAHLVDPENIPSPLSEGLFLTGGGLVYKGHNIVKIPHNIIDKLPEI
jgi:hypothetical protein